MAERLWQLCWELDELATDQADSADLQPDDEFEWTDGMLDSYYEFANDHHGRINDLVASGVLGSKGGFWAALVAAGIEQNHQYDPPRDAALRGLEQAFGLIADVDQLRRPLTTEDCAQVGMLSEGYVWLLYATAMEHRACAWHWIGGDRSAPPHGREEPVGPLFIESMVPMDERRRAARAAGRARRWAAEVGGWPFETDVDHVSPWGILHAPVPHRRLSLERTVRVLLCRAIRQDQPTTPELLTLRAGLGLDEAGALGDYEADPWRERATGATPETRRAEVRRMLAALVTADHFRRALRASGERAAERVAAARQARKRLADAYAASRVWYASRDAGAGDLGPACGGWGERRATRIRASLRVDARALACALARAPRAPGGVPAGRAVLV